MQGISQVLGRGKPPSIHFRAISSMPEDWEGLRCGSPGLSRPPFDRGDAEILLGFRGGCDKVTLHVLEPNRTRQPAGCGQLVHAWAVCGAAGSVDVRRPS